MSGDRIIRRSFPFSYAIILSVIFALCVGGVRAQQSRVGASIEGIVRDSTGAVVPNAKVTMRAMSTNRARIVRTDQRGFFRAQQLPVGEYALVVEQQGFAPYRQRGLQLMLGSTIRLDIVLAPASATQNVTVNAQSSALQPSQTSEVSLVDRERIEELPVHSRNALDFVLLAPGVSEYPSHAPASGAAPLPSSGFTFGGLRARSNSVSIDGLDNNDEYSGGSRTELSPEIVEEFQVVNNGLSAESGGASGGSINVVTRSGSDTIHGDAFIFAQDSAFNAAEPFQTEPEKPSFRRFRAGFALGGPIVKDRSFYYAAAEQEHNRGQSDGDIDPAVASAVNAVLSSGAFPGIPVRSIMTGFTPIARAETEAAGKLDQALTPGTALMLRYAFTNNRVSGDAFNTSGRFDPSSRGNSFISDNSLSGALTTVLGSNAVSDFRFEAATRHAVLRTEQPLGPEIDIAGLVTFGRTYGGNSERRENHYQALYTYSRTAGKHLWKVGATVNRVRLRAGVPDGFGSVYFFDSLPNFLLGRSDQFRQAFGTPRVDFPVTSFGAFVQDHWSLPHQLTLDAGVRYDFERPPSGFHQDTNNFSPRVGLAWNPFRRWVFRAGYGVFFDRYVLANLARAIEKNGSQAFEQVADGAASASIFNATQGAPLSLPLPGIAPSIFTPDPQLPTPYSQQASAGAEYLIAPNLTFRADYLFVHGVKLSRTVNINLPAPSVLTLVNAAGLGITDPTPQQVGREVFGPVRLDPQFDNIYQLQDSAGSIYSGMSFTVSRLLNEDLEFSASYTLSRTYDDASDFDEQPQNPYDIPAEYAVSRQDQPQRFVLSALWDLPIGPDEEDQQAQTKKTPASSPGWLSRAFSHIELAPIITAESGHPVDPLVGTDANRNDAFPLSSRPLGFGRNSITMPSIVTVDFRILKYFPFGGARHLDVVAESFNLLNRANVGDINPVFGSELASAPGFDSPVEALGARRVEFSLDYEF